MGFVHLTRHTPSGHGNHQIAKRLVGGSFETLWC